MFDRKWFVLRFIEGQELAGIDPATGGYPYKTTSPNQVMFWPSDAEPRHYAEMFRGQFEVVTLVMQEAKP